MMSTATVSDLEKNTMAYWRLAKCWNGKSDEKYTVGEAIVICKDLQDNLNPARPLARRAAILDGKIIESGQKRKKKAGKPASRVTIL